MLCDWDCNMTHGTQTGALDNLEGLEGGSRGRGHMFTCGWNQHNIVKQLFSTKNK